MISFELVNYKNFHHVYGSCLAMASFESYSTLLPQVQLINTKILINFRYFCQLILSWQHA